MSQELSPAIQAMLAKSNVSTVQDMDTGSGGVPRISLKKSKFTAKIGDDETKLGDEINVVILGIDPPNGFCKTYYESGYTPGSADAPDCQSDDGQRPSPFVETPMSDSCRTCEKNQWGSAKSMSGGKAKACKDSKRLHVKLAEDLQDSEAPIYIITVTVMSLKPFGAYGKLLAKEGIPTPSICITKLGFNDEASVPQLTFDLVGVMDDDNVSSALSIAEEKPWDSYKNVNALPSAKREALQAPSDEDLTDNDKAVIDKDVADLTNNW